MLKEETHVNIYVNVHICVKHGDTKVFTNDNCVHYLACLCLICSIECSDMYCIFQNR